MNKEALLNLGTLMHGLAAQVSFVRLGSTESVLRGGLFTIKATKVVNGTTYEVTELVDERSLENISDPNVIVDVLINKMGLPKRGTK